MGHKVHPWLQLAHTKPMFRPGLSRNYGCFLALTKAGGLVFVPTEGNHPDDMVQVGR